MPTEKAATEMPVRAYQIAGGCREPAPRLVRIALAQLRADAQRKTAEIEAAARELEQRGPEWALDPNTAEWVTAAGPREVHDEDRK